MPTKLYFGFIEQRPLHVATVDEHEARRTEVVTVYEPTLDRWEPGFRTRKPMKCAICGHGRTGTTTITLEKSGTTLVIRNVPAEICDNCGERYMSEPVTGALLREARQAVDAGIELAVRSFAA